MNANANTMTKPEAKAQFKRSEDPRFLQIYCSILRGVFSQFEIYGPPDEENHFHFGEDGNVSATKWLDDDFVPGRHDHEEYRIAYLVDRALWAAQCSYAAMLRVDEQADDIQAFNATVEATDSNNNENHDNH